MTINCPGCGKSFNKDLFPLGNLVHCPYCEAEFRIEPAPASQAPAPEPIVLSGPAADADRAGAAEPEPEDPEKAERGPGREPDSKSEKPRQEIRISIQAGDRSCREASTPGAGAKSGSPWPAFLIHLGVFSILGFAVTGINWMTSPSVPWSLAVVCPWGAAVLIHLWANVVGSLKRRARTAEPAIENAKRFRRGPMIGFLDAFGSFAAVNGFLFFVDYFTDHRITWAFWIAGMWGIFSALHFWTALVKTGFGAAQPDADRLAAKRARMKRRWFSFLGSFGVYAIVNAGLLALNLALTPGYLWCAWVAAAWGIGVFTGLWRSSVATVDCFAEEKRSAPAAPDGRNPSLVPLVLLNLSMWAAFALAGFAVPALGDGLCDAGPLGRASGVLSEIGRFSVEFPFVYWGSAILASILSFTVFGWSGPGRKRLANAVFYVCSTAFLAASALTAAAVTSGLVCLKV